MLNVYKTNHKINFFESPSVVLANIDFKIKFITNKYFFSKALVFSLANIRFFGKVKF